MNVTNFSFLYRLSTLFSLALLPPTILCALLCLAILQPTLLCTLPDDITTNYTPLYPACRYHTWLSTLPTIRYIISDFTPTDYAVCTTLSGDTPTDHPLFACRYYNRPSALLYLSIVQLTIRSALSSDITNDYPLYSACRHATDYPLCSIRRYSNRL
jgi:hypothetical protein